MGVCISNTKIINKGLNQELTISEMENFCYYNIIGKDKNYSFLLIKNKWNKNLFKLFKYSENELISLSNNQNMKTNISFNSSNQSTNIANENLSSLIKISLIIEYLSKEKLCTIEDSLRKGPPNNIRWLLWINLIKSKLKNIDINENTFKKLSDNSLSDDVIMQINKDLHRTAPEIKYFQSEEGIKSLYNILKSLAIYDEYVSYCQGMNILVANLLLVSDGNQYETFLLIRYIFDYLNVREFYTKGFPLLHFFIYLQKAIIKEKFLNVYKKIEELSVPDEVWLFRWIQTIFMLACDFSICIRIWDCVLADGLDFLLKFNLALIKYYESTILKAEDMCEFVDAFKFKNKNSTVDDLINLREILINLSFSIKLDENRMNQIKNEYKYISNSYKVDEVSIYSKRDIIPSDNIYINNLSNEILTTIKAQS